MKISIQNLKPGISDYKERVKPGFIEANYADFYPNDFDIDVLLDKIDKDFRLKITMQSDAAHYICDRCLEEFTLPVNFKTENIFRIDYGDTEFDDDIIPVASDATEIDLKDILNETVVLNHPIKMLCSADCKGLCSGCGANLNIEKCRCQNEEIDPRWEELRKLIK